jgi:hypothetical protein
MYLQEIVCMPPEKKLGIVGKTKDGQIQNLFCPNGEGLSGSMLNNHRSENGGVKY